VVVVKRPVVEVHEDANVVKYGATRHGPHVQNLLSVVGGKRFWNRLSQGATDK